jgi:hypothetical protein
VTPNLMVVVPTQEQVSMSYGRTPIDYLAYAMTLLGLVGLVLLARAPAIDVPPERPTRLSRWIDDKLTITPIAPSTDPQLEAGHAVDAAPERSDDDIWTDAGGPDPAPSGG